jgi:hypothetical protein
MSRKTDAVIASTIGIDTGPERNLQSEAGYIDARPYIRRIDEISCDARQHGSFTLISGRQFRAIEVRAFQAFAESGGIPLCGGL